MMTRLTRLRIIFERYTNTGASVKQCGQPHVVPLIRACWHLAAVPAGIWDKNDDFFGKGQATSVGYKPEQEARANRYAQQSMAPLVTNRGLGPNCAITGVFDTRRPHVDFLD